LPSHLHLGLPNGFFPYGFRIPLGSNPLNLLLLLLLLFFLFIFGAGKEPSPLLLGQFIGLLYQPWMIDGVDCGGTG
jgi:hypothetical protein